MADTIKHRGPDDSGFVQLDFTTNGQQQQFALAHRRLSIIDLTGGHQPISNETGRIHIVFNGEIYNYQTLRNTLEDCGHIFASGSDTETILHAYEEYGVDCVQVLRGMFAFAIWDEDRQQLFLARDRFGKKPLYYSIQQDVLLFASEAKAIVAATGTIPAVNLQAIPDYLLYRYVPQPSTLFQGVQKLPSGSYALWQDQQLHVSTYYTPPDAQARNAGSEANVIGEFSEKLEEAVRVRMVSDVPFGAFLSGGIDSSVVVALMSRYSQQPVKTFSVGFAESEYSELRYAKTIARQFSCQHHELQVSADELIKHLPELIAFRDAPVAEPSDIPIYLLAKEARKTVKMVLTGEGSDEILGGYPKHVYERMVPMYQKIPGWFRQYVLTASIAALPYRFRRVKTAFENFELTDWQERMPRWFGALNRQQCAELLTPEILDSAGFAATTVTRCSENTENSGLRNILYFDQCSWLPDNLLERGDRMTMAASLEARMPFMDHQLAAFASSLPDHYRVRQMQTKWLLRKAATGLIPKEILQRPKVGFRVPVNLWFRYGMKDYLYETLTGSHAQAKHYYRPEVLQRYLDEHTQGKQNHEKLLWALLNLELWHRHYAGETGQ